MDGTRLEKGEGKKVKEGKGIRYSQLSRMGEVTGWKEAVTVLIAWNGWIGMGQITLLLFSLDWMGMGKGDNQNTEGEGLDHSLVCILHHLQFAVHMPHKRSYACVWRVLNRSIMITVSDFITAPWFRGASG